MTHRTYTTILALALGLVGVAAKCTPDTHHPDNGGYYIEGIAGIISSQRDTKTGKRADNGTWAPNTYYPHGELKLCTGQFCSEKSRTEGDNQYVVAHTCALLRFSYPADSTSTVYEMPSKEAFDACDFTGLTALADTTQGHPHYDYVIEDDHDKKVYYFACKNGCSSGQKVAVEVVDDYANNAQQCGGMGAGSSRIQHCDCDHQLKGTTLIDPCHTAFVNGCMADMPDDKSCCPDKAKVSYDSATRKYVNGGTCIPKSKEQSMKQTVTDTLALCASNQTKCDEYAAMSKCPSKYQPSLYDPKCNQWKAIKDCESAPGSFASTKADCATNMMWLVYVAQASLIAGYEPGSDVSQHNMLDLDQAEFETHLKGPDYAKAKAIYTLGGNSGAKAEITVSALAADAAKGAEVKQGTVAVGKMKSAASAGATAITVSYTSSVCKEGGLDTKDVSGCFTAGGGAITIGGVDIGAPTAVSNKYRTLAGFSTAAEKKMTGQEYFDIYKAYFGVGDYAHQRVMAALDKNGICSACDDAAAVQIAKKTSAYMNVWMYVIREFEDAIDDCKAGCIDCNDDPVHAWDEGVAFWTGSLEGTDGSGSGKMIYALADKRCKNFGTCSGSTHSSFVNEALFKEFTKGKVALQQGKCSEVAPIKKLIVELMSIPLVQGSLRYAYKVAELKGGSKEFAEGAAFSAAILPRVHACDASAAKVISENMNMEIAESARMSAGYGPVKKAFESVYECLGITCASVGGLILSDAEYYTGAEPCGETSKGSCYNAKGDHSVECNVAEADCGGSYYASGFVSSRSGCCHCKASCPMVSDKCKYYDAKDDDHAGHDHGTTTPPASSGGDHDGHDHDDDDHSDAVATTTEDATASGSIRMQFSSALVIGVLFLAYAGVLP